MDVEFMTKRIVHKDGRRVLYTMTTHDKYEFPITVADNPRELAEAVGKTVGCVASSLTHGRLGYHRIYLSEEDTLEMDLEDAKRGNLDAIEFLLQRRSEEYGTEE